MSSSFETSTATKQQKFNHEDKTIETTDYGSSAAALYATSNLVSFYRENIQKSNRALIGLNLRPSTEVQDYTPQFAENDFRYLVKEVCEACDYIVVNLSNANGAGMKQFYNKDKLNSLLRGIKNDLQMEIGQQAAEEHFKSLQMTKKANQEKQHIGRFDQMTLNIGDCYQRSLPFKPITVPMIFLKIDDNLSESQLHSFAQLAVSNSISGIIVGSCQHNNDSSLIGGQNNPKIANQSLATLYKASQGKITLMSSGGVWSASDIIERMKCGASLVQIYSSFAFNVKNRYSICNLKNQYRDLILLEIV